LSQISSTLNGALRSDKNFKIIKFFKTTLFF
jgi:hypothetical protein